METFILITSVLQSMAISLGVGSSTLAILNFFVALQDGKIDETERHFMGATYIILRVSMVMILLTTIILAYFGMTSFGNDYFTNYNIAQFVLIAVLYINTILMTLQTMPSKYGPALQASSWYTLGILSTLYAYGYDSFKITTFIVGYLVMFIVLAAIVNGVFSHLRQKREAQKLG